MSLDAAPAHHLLSWLQAVLDALRGATGVVLTTAAFLVAVMVLVLAQIVVFAARSLLA